MKLFELLAFNRHVLSRLDVAGVKPSDHRYVPLYIEFLNMRNAGDKMTYIVAVLSGRYGISERKVYYIIDLLGREIDCTNVAG